MSFEYLFKSERLGFRNWKSSDITEFAKMNADEEVMKHFPKTLNLVESKAFLSRLQEHFGKHNYNYFAVELLATGEWIGFIGLAYQTYETSFTPATDIGWRLKKSAWGNGYATEGAKACLDYAFQKLHLQRIIATCTLRNSPSEHVMQKIGMTKMGTFNHPKLVDYPDYKQCMWYAISNS